MNTNLHKILVEKNLLTTNTRVSAVVNAIGFNTGVFPKNKEIFWHAKLDPENITAIEGMDPERFAKSYNIKSDGSISKYKKPGRKAKLIA
jgi:hypothetical protein